MQVKTKQVCWIINAPYRSDDGYFETRDEQRRRFHELSGSKMMWLSSNHIPANWLGHTADNPSPGYAIAYHTWAIFDEHEAINFLIACGDNIKQSEVEV